MLKPKTVRYTATIPQDYVLALKGLLKEKAIPSMNYAINVAIAEFLKSHQAAQYEALMKEAGQDEAFLSRTLSCADDFRAVDSEALETW